MDGLEGLCERASKAAARLGSAIASESQVTIVSHNDVDGVSAGTLLFLAIRKQGGSAHLSFTGHVYKEDLTKLTSSRPELLVFSDMGSDLIPHLNNSNIPFLVLDHHSTDQRDDRLVNPWAFGVDGAREISSSGVAYLIAKAMNPENVEFSPIALCGAFGDMQILKGPNEWIASDAESNGLAKGRKEIRLIGRVDRPIEYSISYSTLPFIKGLTGNPMAVRSFLQSTGIDVDPKTSICELDDEMERLLISSLVERMVSEDASTSEAERLFGLTFRLHDALVPTMDDLVDYVEACASLERYSTAFALLAGDPGTKEEVERCRLQYKEKIFEGIRLYEKAVHMENMDYIILEGWTEYSGKLSGIYANAGFSGHRRPVFSLSLEEDSVKVSGRVNPQLIERGLDLGRALSSVSERFGGKGGGHNVAAGAKIPKQHLEEFVRELDKEVGLQLAEGEEGEEGEET